MNIIPHDEKKYPKSLGRIVYKNNLSKILVRTPLKSKLNLMNSIQNKKMMKCPLLKSIDKDKDDIYNKNALPDELEDFMHINENEINIINIFDKDTVKLKDKINYINISKNIINININPFPLREDYLLSAHMKHLEDNISNNSNK